MPEGQLLELVTVYAALSPLSKSVFEKLDLQGVWLGDSQV